MKGFTLIEVVISLTIMAALTVLSSQNIQQAIRSKAKIQNTLDDMSKVRDSLRVMERDINLAYHYRDIEMEFLAQVACRSKPPTAAQQTPANPFLVQQPPPTQPGNAAGGPNPACLESFANDPQIKEKYKNRKDPVTHFVGQNESLDFATMNVGRISETETMADFGKVGYSLKGCKKLDGTEGGQCLVRRFSQILEGDITKGGDETVLLENVSEFKLRYFGKGKQDWNSQWSSLGNDGATKDNFPQAVEVSLAIEVPRGGKKGKNKKISMQIIAPVRFPNNKDKESSAPIGTR